MIGRLRWPLYFQYSQFYSFWFEELYFLIFIDGVDSYIQILNRMQDSQKVEEKKEESREDEELPEHFYDSDIASVNEKDFQSDNEPPKDIIAQRKLLFKEKMLHVYKTILRVGEGIDRPAPYDEIRLRYRKKQDEKEDALKIDFLSQVQFENYNLGTEHKQIQRLVTSMKPTQVAMFEVEQLEISKKTNIKVLKQKIVYTVEVTKWTTVIDLDGDLKYFKYVFQKGNGPNRVHKYDQVLFNYTIECNQKCIQSFQTSKPLKMQEETIISMYNIIWKMLTSMKNKQSSAVTVLDQNLQLLEGEKYEKLIQKCKDEKKKWKISVSIENIAKVDDFYMDGSVLKKTIVKGVSTAKPDSSSTIYYALKYFDDENNILHTDKCFTSDWWEDFSKLEELGCRKNYLDQYKISKMLKASMKRMKPAEVAHIECRDMTLFEYGLDLKELKELWPKEKKFPPQKIEMEVRVYNFTEGRTCFNMEIDEKVAESRRKKVVAVELLKQDNIKKAYKRFQNIISFYSSGDISKEGYEEKISALMNSTLCLMKQQKYSQMIPLCNIILQKPKHGYNPDEMKIKGPQHAKVDGDIKQGEGDTRKDANLEQNSKIIDKCLYRKALALLKLGEGKESIKCLQEIEQKSGQVQKLRQEAEKQHEAYQEKSKKIFKSMFG